MVVKTVTYTNLNGKEETKDCWFHLSEAEMLELEFSRNANDSLIGIIDRIAKAAEANELENLEPSAKETVLLVEEIKRILQLSYGERSADGRRHDKSPEILAEFVGSQAYSALFMELIRDTDAAIALVNGIVPAGFHQKMAELARENESKKEKADLKSVPAPPPSPTTERRQQNITKLTKQQLESAQGAEYLRLRDEIQSGRAILAD